MEETLYRIVFNGETVPGLTAQQIIDGFAKRFQLRAEKAREILLSGSRTVLKRNLDQHKAHRYSSALRKVGLLVVMEPQNPARSSNLSVDLNPSIDITQSELASSFYDATPSSFYYDATPSSFHDATPTSEVTPAPASAPAAAAPGLAEEWARCPKCREPAVSPLTGVCQACGLVVERYVARRAEQESGNAKGRGKGKGKGRDSGPARAANPYAPPAADLKPRGPIGAEGPGEPQPVGVGRVWHWINSGFATFRQAPGAWLVAVLVFTLINGAVNVVQATSQGIDPILSLWLLGAASVFNVIMGQIVIGGLMIGLDQLRRGSSFSVATIFQGFAVAPGSLALLGLVYLGTLILIVAAAAGIAIVGGVTESDQALNPAAWLAITVGVLGFLATWMMFTFAPALVAVGATPPMRALALSLRGCLRNLPAGITYWALWVLIGIGLGLGIIAAGTILALLGGPQSPLRLIVGLAAFVGLIVLVAYLLATVMGSIYAAFRDIYHR